MRLQYLILDFILSRTGRPKGDIQAAFLATAVKVIFHQSVERILIEFKQQALDGVKKPRRRDETGLVLAIFRRLDFSLQWLRTLC